MPELVIHAGRSWHQILKRIDVLVRDGFVKRIGTAGAFMPRYGLTDKDRSLLAERDGDTEYGLGYMQGKGAS